VNSVLSSPLNSPPKNFFRREKLVKIGAKVVKHSRYVTFQMAEVLVSKSLFHEILTKIHRLKPVLIGYD